MITDNEAFWTTLLLGFILGMLVTLMLLEWGGAL